VKHLVLLLLVVSLLALPGAGASQELAQRGFVESRMFLYPQTSGTDRDRAVVEALLRYEASLKLTPWLQMSGAVEARIATHQQVERRWAVDWQDRGEQRPALGVRRLEMTAHRDHLTIQVGKQLIRWGKADILNPTDRFAPRDFLSVVDSDFLGVTAARVTFESVANSLEMVYVPRFTPSRIPLLGQRWMVLPPITATVPVRDGGSEFPRGAQVGARWNHTGSGLEYSLSVYQGFNHLPLLDARFVPPFGVEFVRGYPQMRMYGGDGAAPTRWFTLKGEIGYFTSTNPAAEEYGIYVVQLERQIGEWSLVGGYAGDFVTRAVPALQFAPDRGLARSFLGRASVTLDVNRSLAFEGALHQNGQGVWTKAVYSQASGQHWRTTLEGNWIHGQADDFLGQYRRNSNVNLALRYSF
jgi:hypothetical protein